MVIHIYAREFKWNI